MIVQERLAKLESVTLKQGGHTTRRGGMCAMEAIAWLADEEHSDAPDCVSPVIATFLRRWNDDLDDAGRQMLKPLLPRVIGTAGDGKDELRGWMAADWLVRVHTPAWLEVAGITESAAALRALPPLRDAATLDLSRPCLEEARARSAAARDAAWDAARDAAWDAARAAAWDAARAAARDAAWDAARDAARDAAWDAAWDAARDAAWAAARDAAWAAARKKLAPTKESLQASALRLLDEMIDPRG